MYFPFKKRDKGVFHSIHTPYYYYYINFYYKGEWL